MNIRFSKMHGLGNDFVVIDTIRQSVSLTPDQIRLLANRRYGVGCDQVLLIDPPRRAGTDFHYRIFNADGGEVEQCGNGARCLARYVRDHELTSKNTLRVETLSGEITLVIEDDGQVQVDMGVPRFTPDDIPFDAEAPAMLYPLEVNGEVLQISALSMGNPHAVTCVEDVSRYPVDRLGPAITTHPRFPKGVNAGFMQLLDRSHIRLRVHERGAGETAACGSGACAAVVAGRQQGLLDDKVDVELTGGHLLIQWAGEGSPVLMTGPASHVFEGQIRL